MGLFHLRLLGGFSLIKDNKELSGNATRNASALLCFLAVTNSPQSRSALAGLLWRDMPEKNAKVNLRRTLSDLRKVVGELVQSDRKGVWLQSDWYELDVAKISMPDRTEGLGETQAKVDLFQGEFLDGFVMRNAPAFEEWVLNQRVRVREETIGLLYQLIEGYRRVGNVAAAIIAARRLLEIDFWREEGHRQLMLLLAEDGQRSAALAQYEKCRQLIQEEFDVMLSPETENLYQKIKNGEIAVLQKESPFSEVAPHNLLASPTPFVGRSQEIATINNLISNPEIRLVSIVAAGGMGKTRLALAAAQTNLGCGDYPNGIFFISLAPISLPANIVPALAQVTKFPLQSNDSRSPKQQILDYLGAKKMLLIFDNFEHLLDSKDLLAHILQHAPDVTMLITSRERLNLYGEHVYKLPGLTLAKTDNEEDWMCSEVVQLFFAECQARAGKIMP